MSGLSLLFALDQNGLCAQNAGMIFTRSFSFSLLSYGIVLGVLGGCQTMQAQEGRPHSSLSANKTEDLLEAEEGSWLLVEDDREASPIEKNLKARGEVDPNQISKVNKHSQNVKDSHAKEESHFRVLKLERQMPGEQQTGLYADVGSEDQSRELMGDIKRAPISGEAPSVVDLRTGVHPDKIRIVLDVTKQTQYAVDLRADDQMVVIDLPHAAWNTQSNKSYGGGILESYLVDAKGRTGASVILKTRKPVKILKDMALPPGGLNQSYRIVLDIAPR